LLVLIGNATSAGAQTREQWIEWGERVHGGFGTLIALGIRVGQDAQKRLDAGRRPMAVMPRMAEWNKTLDAPGRYDAVMAADALYSVE